MLFDMDNERSPSARYLSGRRERAHRRFENGPVADPQKGRGRSRQRDHRDRQGGGAWERSVTAWSKLPRPSSTLPQPPKTNPVAMSAVRKSCCIDPQRFRTPLHARARMDGRGLRRPGCETEQLARFRYRGDLAAEVLNDARRLLDKRGVTRCRFAPGEVHCVLHSDAAVATKDEGLCQHGEGMPSGAKARPLARLRQHRLDEAHDLRRRGQAVLDARADLEQRRHLERAVGDEIVRQHDVAGVEDLELRLRALGLHALCHGFDAARRVDYRPSAKPLRVEIERADLRSELDDVSGADFRRREYRARSRLGRLVVARDETAAKARRQVDGQVGIAAANPLRPIALVFELDAGPPALRLARVDVTYRGT